MVLFEILTLAISILILSKSASLVVENAVKLSSFFGISQMAIGFIFISILTTLPELSVSVISSAGGEGTIAAGNVFGSIIANILLVLGCAGFFYGIEFSKKGIKDIGIVLMITTLLSIYIIFNSSVHSRELGAIQGWALILLFFAYLYFVMRRKVQSNGNEQVEKTEALKAFLSFVACIFLVLISASFVVESAVKIADAFNLAKSFIGATIIAIGTSLPELSIITQAVRKKNYEIALGNAIGANMVNITLVLGAAAIINPISVLIPIFSAAMLFSIIANVFLLYVAAVEQKLGKMGGLAFLAAYAVYLIAIFYLQAGAI